MTPADRRRRVLLIAFAYAEGAGSEPGVGFTTAAALAERYDVTVVTDQAWPGTGPDPEPSPGRPLVVRMGPSRWPASWNPWTAQWRLELYYYAWLRTMARRLPALIRETGAELVQHVTYVRYWMPSAVDTAGRPFIWGPVGGGESVSGELLRTSPPHVSRPERFRSAIRAVFERDPALARTAEAASIGLAATPETAARMRRLTKAPVRVQPGVSLSRETVDQLAGLPAAPDGPVRFLSLGRLLHWKGFDLALEALARSRHQDTSLWIVGDGPERARLEADAARLGLGGRVRFLGWLDRPRTLSLLAEGHILLHPSLHDSGGMVCLEAMAASRPVICLEGNGPAYLCGESALSIPMTSRSATIEGLARAMDRLCDDRAELLERGRTGQAYVAATHTAERRLADLLDVYEGLLATSGVPRGASG